MDTRLKVLISAYACEPGKGSEPEVGWRWALEMSRFHEVTVVTRENNRPAIEAEMSRMSGPKPQFVYFDLDPLLLQMKKRFRMDRGYDVSLADGNLGPPRSVHLGAGGRRRIHSRVAIAVALSRPAVFGNRPQLRQPGSNRHAWRVAAACPAVQPHFGFHAADAGSVRGFGYRQQTNADNWIAHGEFSGSAAHRAARTAAIAFRRQFDSFEGA